MNERELFEEECKTLNYSGDMTKHHSGSFYINHTTNWMWQMWLSSKNREGYKLVPVEPSEHQKRKAEHLYVVECASIFDAVIGAVE